MIFRGPFREATAPDPERSQAIAAWSQRPSAATPTSLLSSIRGAQFRLASNHMAGVHPLWRLWRTLRTLNVCFIKVFLFNIFFMWIIRVYNMIQVRTLSLSLFGHLWHQLIYGLSIDIKLICYFEKVRPDAARYRITLYIYIQYIYIYNIYNIYIYNIYIIYIYIYVYNIYIYIYIIDYHLLHCQWVSLTTTGVSCDRNPLCEVLGSHEEVDLEAFTDEMGQEWTEWTEWTFRPLFVEHNLHRFYWKCL